MIVYIHFIRDASKQHFKLLWFNISNWLRRSLALIQMRATKIIIRACGRGYSAASPGSCQRALVAFLAAA